MKRRSLCRVAAAFLLFAQSSSIAFAQDGAVEYLREHDSDRVVAVRNTSDSASSLTGADAALLAADAFVQDHASAFGVRDVLLETLPIRADKDRFGITHVRYSQQLNGIPVFGGELTVHVNAQNKVTSMNGRIIPNVSIDTTPTLTIEEATAKAREQFNRKFSVAESTLGRTKLYVFDRGVLNNTECGAVYLVWEVELTGKSALQHELLYIDAHSGELVQEDNANKGISRQIYDCSYEFLTNDYYCVLDYYSYRNGYTYGRSEGKPARGGSPTTKFREQADVDDAYAMVNSMHSYYQARFDRNGANGQGGIGDGASIALGVSRVDTFFDALGVYPAEHAGFMGGYLMFCQDGLSLDYMGHEYTHGLAYHTFKDTDGNPTGPARTSSSGALEESLCDLFGAGFEAYTNGSTDWLFSSQLSVTRSLSDPTSVTPDPENYDSWPGYPDRTYHPYYYCGGDQSLGRYINTGIPNKAAYLTAMGTTGETNGEFNGCAITGIGLNKVEQIWYQAYTNYFTSAETFNGAYTALGLACADLVTASVVTEDDCAQLTKALQAVEMDQAGRCEDPNEELHTIPLCALSCIAEAETCDGADNDCDSSIDEDFNVGTSCTVGVGACQATGTYVCSADQTGTSCNATAGTATAEICDGIDNDCDGAVDDDFNLGASCTVGTGACQATGALTCGVGGTAVCSATAGTPSDELCDGIDNDCDGEIDEDLVKTCGPAASGVGICQSGMQACSAGVWGECSGAVYPATEICGNGIDEDCNGSDLACPASCTDSDGGKLPKVYGEVTYKGTVYQDRCLNGSTLRESYCASGRYASSSMYCASGCANGKCK